MSRPGASPPGAPQSPPQRRRFRPSCTHLTMTRLYGYKHTCDNCHSSGDFGWVYRCTQDQEDAIEDAIARDDLWTFDDLGRELANLVVERARSPKARQSELSFFDEVTPEQLASYSPEQIKIILKQREKVHRAAAQNITAAMFRYMNRDDGGGLLDSNPLDADSEGKMWLRNHVRPCRYTVCPRCRPGGADRAFLNLGAVADGDIPPPAAVGLGFHAMGHRPVVPADFWKTIGDPEVMAMRREALFHESSSSSAASMLAMLDDQIAQANANAEEQSEGQHEETLPMAESESSRNAGQLKHSPRVENLAMLARDVVKDQGYTVRPPWTPPSSPSHYGSDTAAEVHAVGLAAERCICSGRSFFSLKTNQDMRRQLLTSIPSSNALHKLAQFGCPLGDIPYLDETEYDVGLTQRFDEDAFELACGTPLSEPDQDEETFFNETKSPMMQREEEEGMFMPQPLQVEDGVAVLEESVQLSVPDVVTQT